MQGYAKDPVCGMLVNEEQAGFDKMTHQVDAETFYFCSAHCKEQFETEPQRFIDKKKKSAKA